MIKTIITTPITGHYDGTALDLVEPFRKYSPQTFDRALRLASFYLKYDRKFAIRADVAWGQMLHETGYLQFKGTAKPEWNNFCGLGVTGPTAIQTFKTEDLGVLAQFVHLCWYVYPDHVNTLCGRTYDPRHFESVGKHHPKYNGDTSIGRLSAAWAFPGIEYGDKIVHYVNLINKTVSEGLIDVLEIPVNASLELELGPITQEAKDALMGKLDVVVQMGHVGIYKGMTGTAGERDWTKKLGDAMKPLLDVTGLKYSIISGIKPLPTDPQVDCKVFMSLHCDGNTDPKAHGYTLGFKPKTNEAFKNALSDSYGKFSGLFKRVENSTGGLRLYYMWTCKKEYAQSIYTVPPIQADYYALLEHFFMTNPKEKAWGLANIDKIASHHVNLIVKFLKG